MAKRRRKTLVVCDTCHHAIHTETPAATTAKSFTEPFSSWLGCVGG
ncbi:hypothetical protein [Actinophytocola sp.]